MRRCVRFVDHPIRYVAPLSVVINDTTKTAENGQELVEPHETLDTTCFINGYTNSATQPASRRLVIVRNEICGIFSEPDTSAQERFCAVDISAHRENISIASFVVGSPLACFVADNTWRVQGVYVGQGSTLGSTIFEDVGTHIDWVEAAVNFTQYDLPLPPLATTSGSRTTENLHYSNAVLGAQQCGVTKDGKTDPLDLLYQPYEQTPLSLAKYLNVPPPANAVSLTEQRLYCTTY